MLVMPRKSSSKPVLVLAKSRSRKVGCSLWRRIFFGLVLGVLWLSGADANTTPSKAVGKASASAAAATAKPTKRKYAETSTTRQSMQNDAFDALSDEELKKRVWSRMDEMGIPKKIRDTLFPHIEHAPTQESKARVREFYIACLSDNKTDNPLVTILYDERTFDLVKALKNLESQMKRKFTAKERTLIQLEVLRIGKLAIKEEAFSYANKSCADGEDDNPFDNEDTAIACKSTRVNAFLHVNDDNESEYTGRPVIPSIDVQLRGEQEKQSHLIKTRYFKLAKFGRKQQAEAFYVELLATAILRMMDRQGQFHCLNRNYYFCINPNIKKKWQFAGITFFYCAEAMRSGLIGLNAEWDREIVSERFIHGAQAYTVEPRQSGEDRSYDHIFMGFVQAVEEVENPKFDKEQRYRFFYYDDFEGRAQSKHWRRYAAMIGYRQKDEYQPPTKRWQLFELAKLKIYPDSKEYKKKAIKHIRKVFKSSLNNT